MTARQPRFEVVRSDAGWFARFRAANGRKVWQTEVYTRRAFAQDALYHLGTYLGRDRTPWEVSLMTQRYGAIEVRTVDERSAR